MVLYFEGLKRSAWKTREGELHELISKNTKQALKSLKKIHSKYNHLDYRKGKYGSIILTLKATS